MQILKYTVAFSNERVVECVGGANTCSIPYKHEIVDGIVPSARFQSTFNVCFSLNKCQIDRFGALCALVWLCERRVHFIYLRKYACQFVINGGWGCANELPSLF